MKTSAFTGKPFLSRLALLVAFCTLLAAPLTGEGATDTSSRLLIRPPYGFKYTKIGSKDYVDGQVYLASAKDTVLLKKFGFRSFHIHSASPNYFRIDAFWPREVELDSLPPEVIGVNYNVPDSPHKQQAAVTTESESSQEEEGEDSMSGSKQQETESPPPISINIEYPDNSEASSEYGYYDENNLVSFYGQYGYAFLGGRFRHHKKEDRPQHVRREPREQTWSPLFSPSSGLLPHLSPAPGSEGGLPHLPRAGQRNYPR